MRSWHFRRGNEQWGPLTDAEAHAALARGAIAPSDRVYESGSAGWQQVSEHPLLRSHIGAAAGPRSADHGDADWPLSKTTIVVLNVFITPLVGAVLYYSWKNGHPAAAKFANRTSLIVFAIGLIGTAGIVALLMVGASVGGTMRSIEVRCSPAETEPSVCVIPMAAVQPSDCGTVRMSCMNVGRDERSQIACVQSAEPTSEGYLMSVDAPGFYALALDAAYANPNLTPQDACYFFFEPE